MMPNDRERETFESRIRATGVLDSRTITHRETIRVDPEDLACFTSVPTVASSQATSAPGLVEMPRGLPRITLAFATEASEVSVGFPMDLTVIRRLGEGGMGMIDLARQHSLDREVAIKRPKPGPLDARVAAALLNEARTTGKLEHPSIVPVHALGTDDEGQPVLVMKRIDGVSWAALAEAPDHPFWPTLAPEGSDRLVAHLDILRQVCNALHFAHSRGVIHRDIKPENIMIGAFGEVYLLDWGIALDRSALASGLHLKTQTVGTPCFMPPELLGGALEEHDERSDVYLLGATLHSVLTGRPRHEGGSVRDVLYAAWTSAPFAYPSEIPAELATLCNEATARDPALRPASALAFRRRVAEYLEHRGSVALSRSARQALERAKAANEAPLSSPDSRRLLAEAHFGFLHALRDWPGNADAQEGLQACLEAFVERELSMRNPEGVQALLDELPEPRPTLHARLERLRREIEEEKAQAALARSQTREMDSSTSARARVALFAMGFVALGAIYLLRRYTASDEAGAYSMALVLKMDALFLGVISLGLVFTGRVLFANRIGRQIGAVIFTMLLASLLTDVISWYYNANLMIATIQRLLVGSSVVGLGGLVVERGLLLPAGILFAGGASMMAWPAFAEIAASGAGLLSLASLVVVAIRQVRSAKPGGHP